jgi:hypothetical protein
MGIFNDDKSGFDRIKPGNYQAVCLGVYNLGLQETKDMKGNVVNKPQIYMVFEVDEKNNTGENYVIGKIYTDSFHEKSNLRKHLESWRSRQFTNDELENFDVEAIISKHCFLNITHNKNGYPQIDSITPVPASVTNMISNRSVPEKMMEFINRKQKEAVSLADENESQIPEQEEDDYSDVPF